MADSTATKNEISIAKIETHLSHMVSSDKELRQMMEKAMSKWDKTDTSMKNIKTKVDIHETEIAQIADIKDEIQSIKTLIQKVAAFGVAIMTVLGFGGWYFVSAGIDKYIEGVVVDLIDTEISTYFEKL